MYGLRTIQVTGDTFWLFSSLNHVIFFRNNCFSDLEAMKCEMKWKKMFLESCIWSQTKLFASESIKSRVVCKVNVDLC